MTGASQSHSANNRVAAVSRWGRAVAELSVKDQKRFQVVGAEPKQLMQDIVSVLESQRDRCQRDRWKVRSFHGQELIVRDICAKFIACVKKFMGVVDIVVSFDPIHAALPWAAVRFVLQVGAKSSPSDEKK